MFGSKTNKRWIFPLIVLLLLVGASLACGSGESATPQKVGEVQSASTGEVATPQAAAEPTEAAQVEQQATVEQTVEDTAEPTVAPPQNYKVGDIITLKDLGLAVLGWSTPEGDEFSKPDAGKKFVAVDMVIVNQGADPTNLSSLFQASLKDSTAQTYSSDLMATIAAKSKAPSGSLLPGEKVRGKVGFQIPEDATGLVFVFDPSLLGSGKIFVELGDNPTAVDSPITLPGEKPQQSYKIGDAIQLGDIVVTVNSASPLDGDDFNKPDPDMQFMIVDITLENKMDKPVSISSMLQMVLKDETGQLYDQDLMAQVASKSDAPNGELAAGEKLRGKIGYEVPAGVTGLQFVFEGDLFDAGKVFVSLP